MCGNSFVFDANPLLLLWLSFNKVTLPSSGSMLDLRWCISVVSAGLVRRCMGPASHTIYSFLWFIFLCSDWICQTFGYNNDIKCSNCDKIIRLTFLACSFSFYLLAEDELKQMRSSIWLQGKIGNNNRIIVSWATRSTPYRRAFTSACLFKIFSSTSTQNNPESLT